MALNFPSAPNTNDTYTYNNKTWTYNGTAWDLSYGTLNTGVVVEGTNLYFSNARVLANVTQLGYATNAQLTSYATTANTLAQFAATTSAQLAGVISDETGSGSLVFATSPTLVTPALGTPASGVVTNLTGTASININGTVGATTAAAGAFTTLSATGLITGRSTNGQIFSSGNNVDSALSLDISSAKVTISQLAGAGTLDTVIGSTTRTSVTPTGLAVTGTLTATGLTTLSAATTPLLLSGAGSSSTTLASNYAIRINAGVTAANYGGIFFDGSTAYDSFFGRVPTALSGINDGVGYVTYSGGTPTLRTLFSSTGLAVTGTLSATGAVTLSGGTANGVAYLDASKVLTTGSALTFDGSQIKVTASPPTLVFNSPVSNSARGLLFENSGTQFARMTANFNNGDFRFVSGETGQSGYFFVWFTDGTEKMRLDSSGNLLVGTTSNPGTRKVSVVGSIASTLSDANDIQGVLLTDANGVYLAATYGSTGSYKPLIFNTSGNERARIDTSGNLGIGTSGESMRLAMTGTVADSTYPLIKGTVKAPYSGGWGSLAPETTIGGYQLFTFRTDNGEVNKSSAIEVYLANNTYGAGQTGMRFITGGYNTTNGSETMRITEAGNVGIGTTSPSARLNINLDNATAYANTAPNITNCTAAFTNASGHTAGGTFVGYQLNISGNSQNRISYIGAISDSTSNQGLGLVFGTNTAAGDRSEKMRLDSAGNLGLGVTPSAWSSSSKALQIGATGALFQTASGFTFLSDNAYVDSGATTRYITSNSATLYRQQSGQHDWFTAASGTAGNAISFTQAMTLDASGNLGVGTTSPGARLHAVTNVSSSYGGIIYNNNATGQGLTIRAGSTSSQDALNCQTYDGGISLFTVQGGGNVGIGATSPAAKLDILNTNATYSLSQKIFNASAGTFFIGQSPAATFLSVDNFAMAFCTNSNGGVAGTSIPTNERMRITSAGGLAIGTTTDPGAGNIMLSGTSGTIFANTVGSNRSFIELYNTSTGDMSLGTTYSTASIRFLTGTTPTERMRLDSSGNLGIGTTTPDVFANSFERVFGVVTTGATAAINVSGSSASRIQFGVGSTRYGLVYQDASNYMQIGTLTALPISFVINNTERMRLDSSGNLGIGTTSPRVKLAIDAGSVAGVSELVNLHNQSTVSGHGTSLTFSGYNPTSSYPTWRFAGIRGMYDTTSTGANVSAWGGQLRFFVNRGAAADDFEDVLNITTGGNVGIGTTSPVTKLEVVGAATSTQYFQRSIAPATESGIETAIVTTGNASNQRAGMYAINNYASNSATELIFKSNDTTGGATERMRLPAAGGVQAVTSISVGNATPSASGAGITFPATQSASSDANTLDDYEEGVWTPNQGSGLTVIGTFNSVGRYTKIGNLVTVNFQVSGTTSIACSSIGEITSNLPFSIAASPGNAMGSCMNSNNVNTGAYGFLTVIYSSTTALVAAGAILVTITYQV